MREQVAAVQIGYRELGGDAAECGAGIDEYGRSARPVQSLGRWGAGEGGEDGERTGVGEQGPRRVSVRLVFRHRKLISGQTGRSATRGRVCRIIAFGLLEQSVKTCVLRGDTYLLERPSPASYYCIYITAYKPQDHTSCIARTHVRVYA